MNKVTKNTHKQAFVELEAWEYNSPYLKYQGKASDLGLLAESLIYYDQSIVYLTTVKQFEELVLWFVKHDKFDLLIELLKNQTIRFFYYQFMTTAINNQGIFSIWNINLPKANNQSDFIRLILYRTNLTPYLNTSKRARLYKIIEDNLIDEGSEDYDTPVEDARKALKDPQKCNMLIQAYVDKIFSYFKLGTPPKIDCKIINLSDEEFQIQSNINFKTLDQYTSNKLGFRPDIPIIGEAQSNRLIWTASKYGYDLYLGDVMSTVTGNKLREATKTLRKTKEIITILKENVEFPDIRKEVNEGNLNIEFIMNIRKKGNKFRKWLQQESERDRDALIAYHSEVAKASGIKRLTTNTLKLFGYLGQLGSPFYVAINPSIESGLVAASTVLGGEFLKLVGSRVEKEWKPIIFGDWFSEEAYKQKTKR